MKGTRTRTKPVVFFFLVASLLLSSLLLTSPGLALMALPDIGIDYSTMKVTQAAKLTEAGMANARNGDAISMHPSPKEGKIIFKNLRTNEEWAYPPTGPKGKGR